MTRFHGTDAANKSARKARHRVVDECPRLKAVLRANPEFASVVPGTSGLRKMRVRVKGVTGKSGGYRAIYSKHDTDDGVRIAFHYVFYKGDAADLHADQYKLLSKEAEQLAASIGSVEWFE